MTRLPLARFGLACWSIWSNKRPLKLGVILGASLRVAKEKGIRTPILTQVYELLNQVQWKLT